MIHDRAMFWTIVDEAEDFTGIFTATRDEFLEAIHVAIQADRAEAEAREEIEDADWEQGEVPFDMEDFVDSWFAVYAATAVGAKGVETAQFNHALGRPQVDPNYEDPPTTTVRREPEMNPAGVTREFQYDEKNGSPDPGAPGM